MTKEEFHKLYAMITSDNSNDVHLGMELISMKEMHLFMFRYFWMHSKCTAIQLDQWGLYKQMFERVKYNDPGGPIFPDNFNPEDYL